MPTITPQQKKNQDVIEAGRGAYRMVIAVSGNPHSKQPFRDLWDKGWRLEKRKDEASQRPREDARRPVTDTPRQTDHPRGSRRSPQAGRHYPYVRSSAPGVLVSTNASLPGQTGQQTVITDRLVERFNRRHQTKA